MSRYLIIILILLGSIVLIKLATRGPGPLDWRDKEGNPPERIDTKKETTSGGKGQTPEVETSDLQPTGDDYFPLK